MKTTQPKALPFVMYLITLTGCATSGPSPEPLAYLALDKPKGRIENAPQNSVSRHFHRGGAYFLNVNFRPAADLGKYLWEAEREAGSQVLRQADVRLHTPWRFDFGTFGLVGYGDGEDTVSVENLSGQ